MVAQYNYWEKCLASPIPRTDNSKKVYFLVVMGFGIKCT